MYCRQFGSVVKTACQKNNVNLVDPEDQGFKQKLKNQDKSVLLRVWLSGQNRLPKSNVNFVNLDF